MNTSEKYQKASTGRATLRFLPLGLAVFVLTVIWPTAAWAHTPHDAIAAVRIGGSLLGDHSLLVLVRDALMESRDLGATWRRLTRGLPYARIRDIVLAPDFARRGRAAVATDIGLFATDDRGLSWHPASGDVVIYRQLMPTGLIPRRRPKVGLVADADSDAMLCVVEGQVLASDDAGSTWRHRSGWGGNITAGLVARGRTCLGTSDGKVIDVTNGLPELLGRAGAKSITDLAGRDPARLLFAATDGDGIRRLSVGAEPVDLGLAGIRLTSLIEIDGTRGRSACLVATGWDDGVHVSTDGGQSWSLRASGLTRDPQANDPEFRLPQFRMATGAPLDGQRVQLFVAGFDGLFGSTDLGLRWTEHDVGLTRDIVVGIGCGPVGEESVGVSLYGAGVHHLREDGTPSPGRSQLRGLRTFALARVAAPTGAESWVATHNAVYVLDAERTVRVANLAAGDARPGIRRTLRRLALRPVKAVLRGLPGPLRARLRSAALSTSKAIGFEGGFTVFGSVLAPSPGFTTDGTAFLATWRDGLFRTDDGGRSFARVWRPEPGSSIHDIAVSPAFATDHMLFAATTEGLRMSRDRGERWQPVALPGTPAEAIRLGIGSLPDGRLQIFVSTWTALLRGECGPVAKDFRWAPVMACHDGHVASAIALAPDFADSGIVLINIAGQGLMRSTDHGSTYGPTTCGGVPFTAECCQMPGFPDSATLIAFSPSFTTTRRAYAASGRCLYRSVDAGHEWQPWQVFDGDGRVQPAQHGSGAP